MNNQKYEDASKIIQNILNITYEEKFIKALHKTYEDTLKQFPNLDKELLAKFIGTLAVLSCITHARSAIGHSIDKKHECPRAKENHQRK